ncbi:MAG: threonine/serine exporter family protein, partial [Flavobacteriaceae bacterium]|nr:threonine/serine exporter family protein [Flavobacteriaceae bacterium]
MRHTLSLVGVSLVAGILVGVLSVPFARRKHTPPLVFAIPGVISMVPG